MRPNHRPLVPDQRWPQWREFADFLVRRRVRILLTIFVALFVDYWAGRFLQLSIADVNSPQTILGLAALLAGCALLAWDAGARPDPISTLSGVPHALFSDSRVSGILMSIVGLCLVIDNPQSICLLIGPMILLDLIRLRREDLSRGQGSAAGRDYATNFSRCHADVISASTTSRKQDWLLRSRHYTPVLIVPVVVLAVIAYAWPFNSIEFHESWEIGCLLLSFVGLAIRLLASGQLNDVTIDCENRRTPTILTTDGIFSLVRYPQYWGDYCIGLGVVLIPFVWWLSIAYSLVFVLYYQRIFAVEEEALRRVFGKRFDQWASATPALIPRPSLWRPASRPFAFRTAIKREHATLFLVVALHSSVEWLEHLILDRRVMLEVFYIVLTLTGLTAYLLIRYLIKHTHVLNVQAQ
jgi:protein-S-isoprenylcysteine O-methyltransferase Ste14